MKPAAVRRLLLLYPRRWRERYGDEFAALLETHPATLGVLVDVMLGAIVARLRSLLQWRWTGFRQDFRYAVRGLRLRPGFALAVIGTLALGLGANAVMFGIVDRLLFRPPSFLIAPDRATRVYTAEMQRGKEEWEGRFGYRRYLDLRGVTHAFEAMTPFEWGSQPIGDGADAHLVKVASSGEDLWNMFSVRPVLGHFYSAAENDPRHPAFVAVLSYGYWQTEYAGRADILGQSIHIGPALYTIIGVAPAGFAGFANEPLSIFVPMSAPQSVNMIGSTPLWYDTYSSSWFALYARRKVGVSTPEATADLTEAFRRSYGKELVARTSGAPIDVARPRALAASVLADRGPQRSSESRVATWLAGVAFIVLIIACVNVANLLVARALGRRREIAVRLALGVSRGRLVGQLLIESLVLAVAGGAAGLIIAELGGMPMRKLLVTSADATPVWSDWRVVAYASALVLAAAILTAVGPALQMRKTDVAFTLRAGMRQSPVHRSPLLAALLVTKAALSVVLLVGAGLFVRSLANVRNTRLGFDADRLLWVGVSLRGTTIDSARSVALRRTLVETARRVGGVENAARGVSVPFSQTWGTHLYVPGIDTVSKRGDFTLQATTPEFFATAGTRILRGRSFRGGSAPPPEIVVTESMASRLWPNETALGKCIHVGGPTEPCYVVVGVAENVRRRSVSDPELHYYIPIELYQPRGGGVFVRTTGLAADYQAAVRQELQKVMPGASYVTVTPMSTLIDPTLRSWKLGATMFSVFGGLAILLAAIGLYSVITHGVTLRMHEMGIRIAVGARGSSVVGLIVKETMRIAVPGIALGVAVTYLGAPWVKPMLFAESAHDPVVIGVVTLTLLAAALCAAALPARRAASVDPSIVLRSE